MHVVSVLNLKGGVGKTMTTLTLGAALALRGKRVILVDNDPQGNLSSIFRPEHGFLNPEGWTSSLYSAEGPVRIASVRDNLYLLAGTKSLAGVRAKDEGPGIFADRIAKLKTAGVDFVLIDNNPQLSNLSLAGILAADFFLVPTQAEVWGYEGADGLNEAVQNLAKRYPGRKFGKFLGFIITAYAGTSGQRTLRNDMRRAYPDLLFETVIPRRTAFPDAIRERKTIFEYAPSGDEAAACNSLATEFLRKIG